MFRILILTLPLIAHSCGIIDYNDKIIGLWEVEKMEVEFDGSPDPDADIMLSMFNQGIEFRKNNVCLGVDPDTTNDKIPKYDIGRIWDGTYLLDGADLTINETIRFKIKYIDETKLQMDLFLTLEDYNYNYARLRKLREQGTGEKLTIHYTFKKQE